MAFTAFQGNAFQAGAFQVGQPVTSTGRLQLPVDYYMVGLPQYRETGRTFERMPGKAREDVKMARGKGGRISGPAPSFTSRTSTRGYE